MSTLKELTQVEGRARAQARLTKAARLTLTEEVRAAEGPAGIYPGPKTSEAAGGPSPAGATERASGHAAALRDTRSGLLFQGDNLRVMKALAEREDFRGRFQLLYLDPPFFTKSTYEAALRAGDETVRKLAYRDRWKRGMYEYLRQLTARLLVMRDLLAEDGLIFVHLDSHAAHYVRVLLDEVFGANRFVNEIIWTYKSGGSSKNHFARKHDNILVYAKSAKYKFHPLKEKSYNRGLKPYRFKGVEEFEDELGWYTLVNMKDVWQIDMVGRTSAERTGYATQKPEKLLERILLCATDEGDLCGDFFCGSGTLPAAAARLGRRFCACDLEPLAVEGTLGRLIRQGAGVQVYRESPLPILPEEGKGLPAFDISVQLTEQAVRDPEQVLVSLALEGVRERRLAREMDPKSKARVEKLEKKDPGALIYAWSLDDRFDGEVFRPRMVQVRRNGDLPLTGSLVVPRSGALLLKVVDILGRTVYKRLR